MSDPFLSDNDFMKKWLGSGLPLICFDLFFSGFGWFNIEYLRITNCEIVIDIMRIKFRVRTRDLFESD